MNLKQMTKKITKTTTTKEKEEPEMVCGGKDVTYNALKKRAKELEDNRK